MKNQFVPEEEPQYWTRRYEELRKEAAGGLIGSDCRGMSVLIRQGLVAWMRAWRDPLCSATGSSACGAESPSITLARSWQREATLLLANMALSHLKRTP
ncbi:MAG TPA: hypothetical protein VIS71_09370 [Terrimicrobium sp.]